MTTTVLNTYLNIDTLGELADALKTALADAGDDRIAEGGERRVDEHEVYIEPLNMRLERERLTDGSYVYNLKLAKLETLSARMAAHS